MAVFEITVGGYDRNTQIEGTNYDQSVSTIKIRTEGDLDIVIPGTGSTTVLTMLKIVAQQLLNLEPPVDPGPEWDELLKEAGVDVPVEIIFGIRSEFKTPV
jgi:hypothetical protein